MTDTTSTDMALTDMAPFFERYDRRNRLVSLAALCASLALSAVISTHIAPAAGRTGAPAALVWGIGVLFTPVLIVGWWTFGELIALGRRKTSKPDGRLPVSPDDARNGVRVSNAGFVFNVALTATVIIQQALWVPYVFGYHVPIGVWFTRATMLAVGAVTIYLGNVWPRMPTPRAPERKAAITMKANRVSGWVMVIFGLLVVLLGLFLPLFLPPGHRS